MELLVKRALFLAVAMSPLSVCLALACGEREEYKGSGSRSLEDPTADGGRRSSSSSAGGRDASDGGALDALPTLDADIDAFVLDTGSDVKSGG